MDWPPACKNVTKLIASLDDERFGIYAMPGVLEMYDKIDLTSKVTSKGEDGVSDRIFNISNDVEQLSEKGVAHSTGEVGRAFEGFDSVIHRCHLSREVATIIALDQAARSGLKQLGPAQKRPAQKLSNCFNMVTNENKCRANL